jgi:hypothetical protein
LQFPFVSGQSGVCETAIQIGEDGMNLNFKDLSAAQEIALRKLLSSCSYLAASARWNVSESVLRNVQDSIENDYKSLEAATAVKVAPV